QQKLQSNEEALRQWQEQKMQQVAAHTANARQEAEHRRDTMIAQADETHRAAVEELTQRWETGLVRIQQPIEANGEGTNHTLIDWAREADAWKPPMQFASTIRFGELHVDLASIADQVPQKLALPEAFSLPASLAFPRHASLLIHAGREGREQAMDALRM